MKNLIIGLLILIIAPLEIIICVATLGLYLILRDGDLITSELIEHLKPTDL